MARSGNMCQLDPIIRLGPSAGTKQKRPARRPTLLLSDNAVPLPRRTSPIPPRARRRLLQPPPPARLAERLCSGPANPAVPPNPHAHPPPQTLPAPAPLFATKPARASPDFERAGLTAIIPTKRTTAAARACASDNTPPPATRALMQPATPGRGGYPAYSGPIRPPIPVHADRAAAFPRAPSQTRRTGPMLTWKRESSPGRRKVRPLSPAAV